MTGFGFAVKRFGFKGCGNPHHHLSLLSPQDLSLCENLDLPFDNNIKNINEEVGCSSCGGLLYFQGGNGTSVVCNLTTKQMKVLPPPKGMFMSSCLGYDAASEDYKVIRYISQYYDVDEVGAEGGVVSNPGGREYFELYSFKSGSWREIVTAAYITDSVAIYDAYGALGVYVAETGCCYWKAYFGMKLDSLPLPPFRDHVMSFNFATESFDHFPLPRPRSTIDGYEDLNGYEELDGAYNLVECRGSLGALAYWRPDGYSSSTMSIDLFVWKGTSWDVLYTVSLAHVERPLGLRDNRSLFLEAKHSSRSGQLMVYDFLTGRSRKLDIYDHPGHMTVHFYNESTDPLPDSEPITMIPHVESTDPLPTTSEDEEERKTGMMLKNRRRTRRKRKTIGTVSKSKRWKPAMPLKNWSP